MLDSQPSYDVIIHFEHICIATFAYVPKVSMISGFCVVLKIRYDSTSD